MTFFTISRMLNYGLVLFFGLFLSVEISGSFVTRKQWHSIAGLYTLFLMIQIFFRFSLGLDLVQKIYPLIIHVPLVLILVFFLKKRLDMALVCVGTAYLCCQLPRWVDLAISALSGSQLAGSICYTLSIFPILFLLHRFFVRSAYNTMTSSSRSLLLFGSLPLAYYVFDYATTVYSNALYDYAMVFNEFLPTVLIIFYVLFLTAYHVQAQAQAQNDLQCSMLEATLEQSRAEMEHLRHTQTQVAVYQHDMRHHLTAIEGFLSTGSISQASEYIRSVQADVDSITPKHFCENEIINLLCSSFLEKAAQHGIHLTIDARAPKKLSISDTELCSILSNGLENALNAVSQLEKSEKWVEFYCNVKRNKLLIEVKNPCNRPVTFQDGLPMSQKSGHGYGCISIRSIAEHHHGLCSFEQEQGMFTLRVVLSI